MKKIGLLCMALVLALGSLGVGYAMWSETLTVEGLVSTGELDVDFTSQEDNDINNLDPKEEGYWTGFPTPTWVGDRYDKDVGKTTSTFVDGGTSAKIIVTDAYPCYWGSVVWDVTNEGTIPVKLHEVSLVEISFDNVAVAWPGGPMVLVVGTRYFVDVDAPLVHLGPFAAGDDFSFIVSAHWTDQIDPVTWDIEPEYGLGFIDVTVHVEQDALQKSMYDFKIDFVFAQWNE